MCLCAQSELSRAGRDREPRPGGPGRESSENLESADEFRNVLNDKADFQELNYSAYFAEINQIEKKSLFRIQFLIICVVPGGEKYAARSVMMSWLCHELLWSSRDSQHPTPVPVTRLCCRAEKKEFRNLRQYFPLFASLHDNNQMPSLWVISRAEISRMSFRREQSSWSRWRGLDALSVWWWHILADRNHRELFWHRSKWRVMIRKSPSFKYKLKKRERCNPLVDWFNTRVSRGAKLRGELVPKLLCAQTLHLTHRPEDWGVSSVLSSTQITCQTQSRASHQLHSAEMLTYYLMSNIYWVFIV